MDLRRFLSSILPLQVKQLFITCLQKYGESTGNIRVRPSFIIIGAQRCGTSSMYHYLSGHPHIAPALNKEIHFFDLNYHHGLNWYQGNFPLRLVSQLRPGSITGEASPYYFFYPHTAQRIFEAFPSIKLILLVRNPADRAYSHYYHERRLGIEHLTFEEAISKEPERLDGEVKKIIADGAYSSFNHQHFAYISRGIYLDQLQRWFSTFPRQQILVLKSEDLFSTPKKIIDDVLDFLEIPRWTPRQFVDLNSLRYPQMNGSTRHRLLDFFKPHNHRLFEFLGADFGWDT
jgi:hypothetical protein